MKKIITFEEKNSTLYNKIIAYKKEIKTGEVEKKGRKERKKNTKIKSTKELLGNANYLICYKVEFKL